jgi:neutral ceramidase
VKSTQQVGGFHHRAGAARVALDCVVESIGMMGYGRCGNVVKGVATPLYARAIVIQDIETGDRVALVNAEICYFSVGLADAVWSAVRKAGIGLDDQTVMLTAQHTHSGPAGYNKHPLYDLPTPGFSPRVFNGIVSGVVSALQQAAGRMAAARLRFTQGEFPSEVQVAFNRSLKAYNSNPDVSAVPQGSEHLAVSRRMQLLRVERPTGDPLAVVSWFGVHATSIPNTNQLVSSDNKGHAAMLMEQQLGSGAVAIFAQSAAGDVSPNGFWDARMRQNRGPADNGHENARLNGHLQYQMASQLLQEAKSAPVVAGGVDGCCVRIDFSKVRVDARFADGREDARTSPSCHGLAFARGTTDGPGCGNAVATLLWGLIGLVRLFEQSGAALLDADRAASIRLKYETQSPKSILVESGEKRLMGTGKIRKVIIPGWADPTVRRIKSYDRRGAIQTGPLTPQVLPLQVLRIGKLIFPGIPGEPTTVAGRRLEQTVLHSLPAGQPWRVVLTPYANGYCGYLTTAEEYQQQSYEGGHTVFGRWTLAAFQTQLAALLTEFCRPKAERSLKNDPLPDPIPAAELARRQFPQEPGAVEVPDDSAPPCHRRRP